MRLTALARVEQIVATLLFLTLLVVGTALAQEDPSFELPRRAGRSELSYLEVSDGLQTQRLEPAEAAEHIGENVTVCGWVTQATFRAAEQRSPTLMWLATMSVPEPDVIRVVVWGEDRDKFPEPPEVLYADDFICVSGELRDTDELPLYIEVTDPVAIVHPPKQHQDTERSAEPERTHYVPLEHTMSMMRAGILGELKIQYAVDETGNVIATRLLRDTLTCSGPENSAEAVEDAIRQIDATVRQWRYAPTLLDGEPAIVVLETMWNAGETGIALMRRAAELSNIRAEGAEPFLLRAQVRMIEPGGVHREGTYTLAWRSPDTWRQQVGFGYGYRDIEIANEGRRWRENTMNDESLLIEASQRPEELRHLLGFVSRLEKRSAETINGYRLRDEDGAVMECVQTLDVGNVEHELCFDSAGALVLEEDKGAANEYSGFAPWGDATFPRAMRVLEGEELDSLALEVEIGTLRRADLDPASFALPDGAEWPAKLGDQDMTAPVQVSTRLPEYTPSATRGGIQGDIYIEAVVTEEGTVESPRLVRGLPDPEINRRALTAILEWRFEPGRKDGRPVRVLALFTVTFRIH